MKLVDTHQWTNKMQINITDIPKACVLSSVETWKIPLTINLEQGSTTAEKHARLSNFYNYIETIWHDASGSNWYVQKNNKGMPQYFLQLHGGTVSTFPLEKCC